MNSTNNPFFAFILTTVVVITIQACAGMGSVRGQDVRIYHENIDKMVEISREAIHNKGYSVTNIRQRREESQRTIITFVNRTTAGQEMVSSMQARVFLAKVDTADAVEVRVDNPDYNYGTPTDQRLDYSSILFTEIDKLLE